MSEVGWILREISKRFITERALGGLDAHAWKIQHRLERLHMAHSRCILEIYRQTAALNRGSILPIFKWSTLTGAPRTEKQAFVRCCQKPPVNFVHFSAPWIKFWS